MSNTTISIDASGLYCHGAPIRGGQAVIRAGELRKGLKGSTDYIGLIYFKPEHIQAVAGSNAIQKAQLVLRRSESSGRGSKTISITQYRDTGVTTDIGYTHRELYDKTYKSCYVASVPDEEQVTIDLPGSMIRRWSSGYNWCNVLALVNGVDESSNDYVVFSGATLNLTYGNDWEAPVWGRPISTDDLVYDDDHSHRDDLWELQYYYNIRAALAEVTPWADTNRWIEQGYYRDWYLVIRALWALNLAILAKEGKPIPNQADCEEGSIPDSWWINLLREYADSPLNGQGSRVSISNLGCAYYTTLDGFHEHNEDWVMDWRAGSAPRSGKVWGWIDNKTKKEYSHRVGVWVLPAPAGIVNSLALRLTTSKGQDRGNEDNIIRLYPLKTSTFPAQHTRLGVAVDLDTVAGEATSAGVGRTAPGDFVETVDVTLSAEFISGLQGGTYYGVAVECDQVIREYTKTATLLINGG